jgi:hypothetical protein
MKLMVAQHSAPCHSGRCNALLREWAVSVRRRSRYAGPLVGLIDETDDLRGAGLDELAFGPYREDPACFTCLLSDEWDVATLMRILAHET